MAIDLTKMKPGISEHGQQRVKLPADEAGGYTGTQTLYMTYAMRELLLSNDDASASLTVNVTSDSGYTITFTVLAGEVLDERYYPFNKIIVTATGAWRYLVRSGLIT
jgi:hypothetical protein